MTAMMMPAMAPPPMPVSLLPELSPAAAEGDVAFEEDDEAALAADEMPVELAAARELVALVTGVAVVAA